MSCGYQQHKKIKEKKIVRTGSMELIEWHDWSSSGHQARDNRDERDRIYTFVPTSIDKADQLEKTTVTVPRRVQWAFSRLTEEAQHGLTIMATPGRVETKHGAAMHK